MSASGKSQGQAQGQASGPKVLRIGIVQRGKLIDEREQKKRESVTIGNGKDSKATFQVASDALPASFNLFEYDGKKYYLRYAEGMEGRIQLQGTQVQDFKALEGAGKTTQRSGCSAVELADESRGKVMIGDLTILFQFKAPLPAPVRPVLPADIKGTLLQNIDTQFASIFVIVAILQISLVTYARNQPYLEPTSIEQVSERYQRMIMPDRMPEPPKVDDTALAEDKGDEGKKEETAKKDTQPAKSSKKKGDNKPVDAEAAARARKDAIKKEVAGKGLLRVLGAERRGAKGALADVFEEGGGAVGELGDAFSGIQGVDFADSAGATGTRGGGSGTGVGIGDLATEGGGSVESGVKTEVAVKGAAKAEAPEVDGELSQAAIAGVMKRQLKALRSCYEGALKRDRTLSGKLIIRFEIEESGRTSNIEFEDVSLNSEDVKQCIRRRAKYWRFPKPDGGSVFVAYPIVFTPAS